MANDDNIILQVVHKYVNYFIFDCNIFYNLVLLAHSKTNSHTSFNKTMKHIATCSKNCSKSNFILDLAKNLNDSLL